MGKWDFRSVLRIQSDSRSMGSDEQPPVSRRDRDCTGDVCEPISRSGAHRARRGATRLLTRILRRMCDITDVFCCPPSSLSLFVF